MYKDDKYADATIEIKTEGGTSAIFKVHTLIIKIRSPYFKRIAISTNEGVLNPLYYRD